MLPASFIIGKGLAELRTWTLSLPDKLRVFKTWFVPLLFLVLILSGSLPGLVPMMVNPYQRSRQEAIFDSMQWFSQHNSCTVVASGGLWPDYIYMWALTSVNYTGDFVRPADVILGKSTELGFTCIAVSTDNQYFNTFQANPDYIAFYHNDLVWIFAISHAT